MTRRLLLSYLTITVIVLLLLGIPLGVFYQQRELDRLTADVERDATVLATIYEDALEKNLEPDPIPAQDYAATTAARVVVVDLDGISIVDTEMEIDRDFSTRPEMQTALEKGRRATGTRRSDTLDTDLLYVAVPVASGGTVHGAVRVTLDTHEVTERILKFWYGLVAIAVVILTVMGGVGWIIARSVTRPVRRLQAAATRFSSGDLTPIDNDSNAPPELAALEHAMNDMAGRLDELIERQRSFVADASHQLRTPLTALRLQLENLQFDAADTATGNGDDTVRQLGDAIDETTRLATLVNDLLQLARTEKVIAPDVVDLTELVRDRVDIWTATAEQHDVDLTVTLPTSALTTGTLATGTLPNGSDPTIHGSAVPGGIEQVLDNLIDNAIRAAPAGTSVDLKLSSGTEMHEITIADHGRGISDEDKTRALKRFWRSDDSVPGTGLGLAIAESIMRVSNGTLDLDDNTPSGLVVTLRIPAAPSLGSADVDVP